MKRYVKRLPFIEPIARAGYRVVYQRLKAASDRVILARMANSTYAPASALALVLHHVKESLPQPEEDLIARIEKEREQLLRRNEPLDDGSFGQAGLYDNGVTIKAACKASKPAEPSLLLYLLIRAFKPLNILELGTNLGISSAYQAIALQLNGQNGRLITLDASPYRIRYAKDLHRTLEIDNVTYIKGLFFEKLNCVLNGTDYIDFSFIDGHHQYQSTIDYIHEILFHSKSCSLFAFDDIRWSNEMKLSWSKIQMNPQVCLSADLNSMGVCIGEPEISHERYQFPPIYSALF